METSEPFGGPQYANLLRDISLISTEDKGDEFYIGFVEENKKSTTIETGTKIAANDVEPDIEINESLLDAEDLMQAN